MQPPTAARISLDLPDEAATQRLGTDLAMALKPGDCIALDGPLGAGKSTLARALIRAFADDDELDVPSPTFTLVQSYDLRFPIAHFDLYRLSGPDELDELGLDDALETGAALIEWPDRAGDLLPANTIHIAIHEAGKGRSVAIDGPEPTLGRIRRSLLIRDFLGQSGMADAERRFLVGDASTRAYETVHGDGEALILMNAPRQPDGPPIRDGKPYSQLAHLAEDVTPFIAIDGVLRDIGLAAPAIPHFDTQNGLLLIEDLGRQGMLDETGRPVPERYAAAIDCLAHLHDQSIDPDITLPDGSHYRVPAYDRGAMGIETELLIDWYVPWKAGAPASDAVRADYLTCWGAIFDRLEKAETGLVLRDYHSPNLIWREDRQGTDRVGIIDIQDALIGPVAYDVASLAQDARVDVEQSLADDLVARYVAARTGQNGFDAADFREAFAIMAAQRASKILGIFVRLNKRDGKPGYMRHLPRMERYLATSLAHPALADMRDWCRKTGVIET